MWIRNLNKEVLIVVLVFAGLARAGESSALKPLYDQHRWFELHEAVQHQEAPALYKGAVASAFNDTKAAEKYLNQTIKLEPNSANAEDAHKRLADLCIRSGRYHEAVQQLDQALRIKPASPDVVNARAIFAAWSRHPDQSIRIAKSTSFHTDVTKHGVKLPVSIHGKSVHWLLDTGGNLSVMSESEARMLGVAIDELSANVADSVGGTTKMRTAMVDELAIGGLPLRNVGFLILPDSQQPIAATYKGFAPRRARYYRFRWPSPYNPSTGARMEQLRSGLDQPVPRIVRAICPLMVLVL
jgi:Aspartyl protease/Tetratricopeptide repeat